VVLVAVFSEVSDGDFLAVGICVQHTMYSRGDARVPPPTISRVQKYGSIASFRPLGPATCYASRPKDRAPVIALCRHPIGLLGFSRSRHQQSFCVPPIRAANRASACSIQTPGAKRAAVVRRQVRTRGRSAQMPQLMARADRPRGAKLLLRCQGRNSKGQRPTSVSITRASVPVGGIAEDDADVVG